MLLWCGELGRYGMAPGGWPYRVSYGSDRSVRTDAGFQMSSAS